MRLVHLPLLTQSRLLTVIFVLQGIKDFYRISSNFVKQFPKIVVLRTSFKMEMRHSAPAKQCNKASLARGQRCSKPSLVRAPTRKLAAVLLLASVLAVVHCAVISSCDPVVTTATGNTYLLINCLASPTIAISLQGTDVVVNASGTTVISDITQVGAAANFRFNLFDGATLANSISISSNSNVENIFVWAKNAVWTGFILVSGTPTLGRA